METKQKYLRDIRDAINGVETAMPGVAGESEATYLRDIAKAIRSSGIDPSIPKVTDADNGKILKVVNGVWAKADDEGVLYGEETPASTLGKDGDVYVRYDTRSEEEALIENQQILDTDYITDILAEDYEILKFYVYQYVRSTETEYDHYMVNVAMSYLMEYNHVEILDSDDHVIANITITNDGHIKIINNSSIQEYYLVFSIYEPVVKPNSITDIYLKVDDEWIKDEFGGSDNDIITYETTITTTEHGWWVVKDKDGEVLDPDEYELINVIVRIDNNAQGSWNAYGFMWFINKELGDTDYKYLGSIIDINNWRRPDNPGTYTVQVSYRKKQD